MAYKYRKMVKTRKSHEKADCGVIAVALTARVDYDTAHSACKTAGRMDRNGMYWNQLQSALKSLGMRVEEISKPRQKSGSKYTPKSIGKDYSRGYYVAFVRGHFFTVINGVVEDWSHDTRKHVNYLIKVTKPRK